MLHCIVEKLGLLEGGMKLHLQSRRFDPAERQNSLKLRNGHITHADVAHQPLINQLFTLTPGFHELFHREGPGIRVSGVAAAARCMIVREGPVNEKEVDGLKP